MLHTAGFGYEFFSHDDLRYRQSRGIPSIIECTFESVQWVLFSDPGGRWNYGVNIDLGGHPPGNSQYPWSRGAPGGLAPELSPQAWATVADGASASSRLSTPTHLITSTQLIT
jgi:hypothetical protein